MAGVQRMLLRMRGRDKKVDVLFENQKFVKAIGSGKAKQFKPRR